MSKLSKALKRLKQKLKGKNDEVAPTTSKLSSLVPKKIIPAHGSYKPSATSNITTSSIPKQASSLQEVREARLQKFSLPVPTSMVVAPQLQPPTLKEAIKSEPQSKLVDTKEVEDQAIELAKSSSPEKVFAVEAQPKQGPKASALAPKNVPQLVPVTTVTAPKVTPHPLLVPIVTVPTIKHLPSQSRFTAPKATAPEPASESVSKPAIQGNTWLYYSYAPDVTAIDQPTPKSLYEAKQTASSVLQRPTPPFTGSTSMRSPNARSDAYADMMPTPSYTSYARISPYASEKPLGAFRTGGPVGGGLYTSTGGVMGGGKISQTGGSFGQGSVSHTGGSLGEAVGAQSSTTLSSMVSPQLVPLLPRFDELYVLSPNQVQKKTQKHAAPAQHPSEHVGRILLDNDLYE